ncbi:hypothetical protein MC45_17585 [Sphingomonas taxi]|uniref:Uncharacterized protein n=1 Tax=Sphingomonas taxi TaxID=1549858 RepID=A0A097EJX3_9SPHN|nr:DUF6445 family protein [Sphingomonas taxi]AIT07861.1 hypothetical protein MC45_17585 [Sphingomonas taxi]
MTPPDIVARRIGNEAEPIAIIDGFHPDPDALRSHAATAPFEPGRHHYPGLRASLPATYFAAVRPALTRALAGVFNHDGALALLDSSYALVTTPPARLTLPQRLPHVDAVDPRRIALVHYLDPDGGDGTAFYRHRSTGFERLDRARAPIYFEQLDAELRHGGVPAPAYIHGSTPLFERIALVEARYNRAVLYRSALLHSGAIAPDAVLSDDPTRGRLTITAFLAPG